MASDTQQQLELVQRYQGLQGECAALDAKIDALMNAHQQRRDQLTAADLSKYRQWARQRSEILNEMRMLERDLNLSAGAQSE